MELNMRLDLVKFSRRINFVVFCIIPKELAFDLICVSEVKL